MMLHMERRYRTLADYFEQTGKTHQELADQLGVTRFYVTLLSHGQRTPSLPMALRIQRLTGVPVESMVGAGAKAS